MDPLDYLRIRFHFGGHFSIVGGIQFYIGGGNAESWVEIDKLSFFEIKGHLGDHFGSTNVLRLYWLIPGKHVSTGLVLLQDDSSVKQMASFHSHGVVVDIYVEEVVEEEPQLIVGDQGQADDEGQAEDQAQLVADDEAQLVPDDVDQWLADDEGGKQKASFKGKGVVEEDEDAQEEDNNSFFERKRGSISCVSQANRWTLTKLQSLVDGLATAEDRLYISGP
jgi:hypothetical protein